MTKLYCPKGHELDPEIYGWALLHVDPRRHYQKQIFRKKYFSCIICNDGYWEEDCTESPRQEEKQELYSNTLLKQFLQERALVDKELTKIEKEREESFINYSKNCSHEFKKVSMCKHCGIGETPNKEGEECPCNVITIKGLVKTCNLCGKKTALKQEGCTYSYVVGGDEECEHQYMTFVPSENGNDAKIIEVDYCLHCGEGKKSQSQIAVERVIEALNSEAEEWQKEAYNEYEDEVFKEIKYKISASFRGLSRKLQELNK